MLKKAPTKVAEVLKFEGTTMTKFNVPQMAFEHGWLGWGLFSGAKNVSFREWF